MQKALDEQLTSDGRPNAASTMCGAVQDVPSHDVANCRSPTATHDVAEAQETARQLREPIGWADQVEPESVQACPFSPTATQLVVVGQSTSCSFGSPLSAVGVLQVLPFQVDTRPWK
jgi:hypothetical protein